MKRSFFSKLFFIVSLLILACTTEDHVKFIDKLESGEQVKIVTLGTSLTGGKWRWPDVMMEWLNEDYPGLVSMKNLGVGASASMTVPAMKGNKYIWNRCGLDRVKEAAESNPDVVFIEFEVNDAFLPYNISVAQSRKNLESMIDTLKKSNPEVEIILQSMNVVIDMPELQVTASGERPRYIEYIEMYKEVAKARNLLLIDHYPNYLNYLKEEGRQTYVKLVPDGIHPNLDGYRKILLPELKRVLQ